MVKGIKIKRKELKQPDQFISITDVILAYCLKHKTGLTFVVTALVLVIFFGLWNKHNQNVKGLAMEALYFKIEQTKAENSSNPEEIVDKIEILLNEFSEGPQKQRAVMILADQYYEIHSYNLAISLYQDILAKTSPTELQYQLASTGMAYSLEGKKDYKGAIVAYKSIIEDQNTYPLFHVYLSLARCYELNNNQNDALLTLREMKTRFSNHPKLKLVKSRLKKLDTPA